MSSEYNAAAGRSIERLGALSDGLFAIAMTLLMLELHVPEPGAIHTEAQLGQALVAFLPRLAVCIMSFLTLGIFWIGQQSQLAQLARGDRDLTWLHIGFLFLISTVPLSTRLLLAFPDYRLSVGIYWLNILLMGVALRLAWQRAVSGQLTVAEMPASFAKTYERRIVTAQLLYAGAALLAFISPAWAIGAIVAVQIGYAVAVERIFDGLRRPKAKP